MVITSTDAEVGLFTTTAEREVMVLSQTGLLDSFQPVGVVVVHLVLREAGVVVELRNVAGRVAHGGVEILFLE